MSEVKRFRDDLSWRWRVFAGRQMLVTDGGGMQVILAGEHQAAIVTRDMETGRLRPIAEDDAVAKIMAAAPDIRRHALALIHGLELGLISIEPTKGGTKSEQATDRASIGVVLHDLRKALVASGARIA